MALSQGIGSQHIKIFGISLLMLKQFDLNLNDSVSEMTYTVSSGLLNSSIPYHT